MGKLEYCPNCGHKIEAGNEFCPNCGYNIKKFIEENTESEADVKEEVPVESSPKMASDKQNVEQRPAQESAPNDQPPKKRNKSIWWIVGIIVILLGGYLLGNWYYGRNRQVQNLQDEVTSGKTGEMKLALVDENGNTLSTNKIGALKRLYIKDSSAIQKVRNQINSNDDDNSFSVQESGKMFGIFKKYKVRVRNQELSIDTNIDNPTFTVDDKNVAARVDGDEYKLSDLTPGVYDITVKSRNKSDQDKSKQVTIHIGDDDNEVTMNVEKVKQTTTKDDDDEDNDREDDNDSDDLDTNDSDDAEDSNDNDESSSNDSLVGDYTGDPDLSLYSDGSYQLGDKSGTYQVVNRNGNHIQIKYNQSGGGSVTESYSFDGTELYSSKYDESWYKWN